MYKEIQNATYACDPHYLGEQEGGGAVWGDVYFALVELSSGRRFESHYCEHGKVRCKDEYGYTEGWQDVSNKAASKINEWLKSLNLDQFSYATTLAEHFCEVAPVYGSAAFQRKEAFEGPFLDQE